MWNMNHKGIDDSVKYLFEVEENSRCCLKINGELVSVIVTKDIDDGEVIEVTYVDSDGVSDYFPVNTRVYRDKKWRTATNIFG